MQSNNYIETHSRIGRTIRIRFVIFDLLELRKRKRKRNLLQSRKQTVAYEAVVMMMVCEREREREPRLPTVGICIHTFVYFSNSFTTIKFKYMQTRD